MTDPLTIPTSIGLLVLMSGLFGSVYRGVLRRYVADVPPAAAVRGIPHAAVAFAGLWLLLSVVNRLARGSAAPPDLTLSGVQFSCLISLAVAGLLALVVTQGVRERVASSGLSLERFERQIYLGTAGHLAVIGPTGLLLILSSLWRTLDTQHSHLKALRGDSGPEMLFWIVLSAVAAAPLAEELLFRVTLQSWLGEWLSGRAAIAVTAAAFALVHGWRDAIPLAPLALLLGYTFYKSRSYWACVMTHSLFNATNIGLALWTMRHLPES